HERDLSRPGRSHGVPQVTAGPEVELAHPAFEAVGSEPLLKTGGGGPQLPDEPRRSVVGALEPRGVLAERRFGGHRFSSVAPPSLGRICSSDERPGGRRTTRARQIFSGTLSA